MFAASRKSKAKGHVTVCSVAVHASWLSWKITKDSPISPLKSWTHGILEATAKVTFMHPHRMNGSSDWCESRKPHIPEMERTDANTGSLHFVYCLTLGCWCIGEGVWDVSRNWWSKTISTLTLTPKTLAIAIYGRLTRFGVWKNIETENTTYLRQKRNKTSKRNKIPWYIQVFSLFL